MTIGFTGTRRGLTGAQRWTLESEIARSSGWLVHGDCFGADEDAHDLARKHGLDVAIRPCTISGQRAYCIGAKRRHPPEPPLTRNRKIVDDCDVLIACPHGPEEPRSGTWSTVRYARRRHKPIVIVWPDGQVTREGQP